MERLVDMKNVSVRTNGRVRLEDVSFEVNQGEHRALLGLNGSGKTTLLQAILGQVWATEGVVHTWFGRHGRVNMQDLRREIGIVSNALDDQYQHRAGETAFNVALSGYFASIGIYEQAPEEITARAENALHTFGVSQYRDVPYAALSQGEKRRVMLARAWTTGAKLLLLDEPCTGLDVKGREELIAGLEASLQNPEAPTVLYVTHHLEELPGAVEAATIMKNGRVQADGKKQDVLTDEEISTAFDVNGSIQWHEQRPWFIIGGAPIR
ncbi:ABC transporter ATP-binding protein [Marinococcus halotolerans]|uniref:ABC transporter ATP-binding protein n=1 Tax=Marinococcus halotolerans TaxID=301092 RepID=UPI0003B62FD1|nr:ATP-binding cassette domain-containing protein [Marinococcus halotolerans]